MKQSIQNLLVSLNPSQQEAVLAGDGPVVVFAGAGSGKTRVIIHRIAVLIEQDVHPGSILAMTFTNKAAKEMTGRLAQLTPLSQLVPIGTFHSICARWLREFATELGFTSDFTIYDDKEGLQALKTILKSLDLNMADNTPADYLSAIGRAKTYGLAPEELSQFDQNTFPEHTAYLYRKYQEYLLGCNAMDFNDLLLHMLFLLRNNPKVKATLARRYKYVLIDEYQDTNHTQYSLITSLVSKDGEGGPSLFVVGDDDQSIYSWRGANPHNILNFTNEFDSAKEIRLEQNYRCSKNIVDSAAAVIAHNKLRAEKTLWTDNPAGEPLEFIFEYDAESESQYVCQQVDFESGRFPYRQVAVFYRTNAQSRQLEDCFRQNDIPYQIYGSLKFYDRTEIKDIISYLRLLVNRDDDLAFRRIVNVPTRKIGKKSLDDLAIFAAEQGLSLYSAVNKLKDSNPKLAVKFASFITVFEKLKQMNKELPLGEFVQKLIGELSYQEYVEKKFPKQAQDKLANLMELGSAIVEYSEKNEKGLSDWLVSVSLLEEDKNGPESGVTLMTLHSAKGLEFERVYIVGVEDGLLPHVNSQDEDQSLEEERRLLYVGMTRAKQKLTFIAARRRRVYDKFLQYHPSRFLREIPTRFFQGQESSLTEY